VIVFLVLVFSWFGGYHWPWWLWLASVLEMVIDD
jgi:hypothetical protein